MYLLYGINQFSNSAHLCATHSLRVIFTQKILEFNLQNITQYWKKLLKLKENSKLTH